MERNQLVNLVNWKQNPARKPLIVNGARQVGKTWLLKEFGRKYYQNVTYINFEVNTAMREVFKQDFDLNRILLAIQIETGIVPEAENTLIIFDEIQQSSGALIALKYFNENAPQYHVVSAGSLLGVALSNESSFPVGKVDFLELFPLNFQEFLVALGQSGLVDIQKNEDWDLVSSFHEKLKEYLKYYYLVGGMPESVASFVSDRDFSKVREIQKRILLSYELDFAKHIPSNIVPGVRLVWNSIPSQLAKENKKFIFKVLKQGARAREFEKAIDWLIDSGLVIKINNVDKPAIPLKAYEDLGSFKLFGLDVGLLAAMVNLSFKSILTDGVLIEFKGALTEQYVLQQLVSTRQFKPFYWSPQNVQAELDFIIEYENNIIPVEVKSSENLQAKSLRVFQQKFEPQIAIRTSMSTFRNEGWLINVPLYSVCSIPEILANRLQ